MVDTMTFPTKYSRDSVKLLTNFEVSDGPAIDAGGYVINFDGVRFHEFSSSNTTKAYLTMGGDIVTDIPMTNAIARRFSVELSRGVDWHTAE